MIKKIFAWFIFILTVSFFSLCLIEWAIHKPFDFIATLIILSMFAGLGWATENIFFKR